MKCKEHLEKTCDCFPNHCRGCNNAIGVAEFDCIKDSKAMTDAEIIKALERHIVCTSKEMLLSNNGITYGDLLDLINRQQAEIERLKANNREVFIGVINKILTLKDVYTIVENEFVPWEPTEEVEHLFGITLSGENKDIDNDLNNLLKEMG